MTGEISASATTLVAACEDELAGRGTGGPSQAELVALLSAGAALYAARLENDDTLGPPVDMARLSATAVLTTACEMIRATRANMFDVSMWFARRGD